MTSSAREVVARLRDACIGHPNAQIPWPHRLLHDAITEIERLQARLDAIMALFPASPIKHPQQLEPVRHIERHLANMVRKDALTGDKAVEAALHAFSDGFTPETPEAYLAAAKAAITAALKATQPKAPT